MTSEPIADGVGLYGSLIKYLQTSGLSGIRELVAVDGISCDSGRANACKGDIRGTKSSGRDGLRGGQVLYAAVWLLVE